MRHLRHITRYGWVIALVVLALGQAAWAAEPQFLVSWEAKNTVPVWFEGKSFPTNESTVAASFELVSQNKADFGKVISLSNREVRWYLNDQLVRRGNGLQTFNVGVGDFPGSETDVRISVEFYDSETKETRFIDYRFAVPVIDPVVVLWHPSFSLSLPLNQEVVITAFPFFFNVADRLLNVIWDVNGKQAERDAFNPLQLALKVSGDVPFDQVRVGLRAENPRNSFESVSTSRVFTVR